VGDEFLGDKQIIPEKQDLGHDIAVVAEVFEGTKKASPKVERLLSLLRSYSWELFGNQ